MSAGFHVSNLIFWGTVLASSALAPFTNTSSAPSMNITPFGNSDSIVDISWFYLFLPFRPSSSVHIRLYLSSCFDLPLSLSTGLSYPAVTLPISLPRPALVQAPSLSLPSPQ